MSSSGYPHLHRVNLHSHGKRPFEECGGYDSDPDNSMPIQPTTSNGTSSSNNHRYPTTAPPTSARNPEARNKRARSTSSTSTDGSSSNPSSSSGYNTAQSSSRSDISSDGPSALSTSALDCPVATSPPFPTAQDVHMSDLHLPIPPPQPLRTHVPTPPTQEDTFRTSLQRFAEFDRQIAALRNSLAATRSPPLPLLGPSVDGDPAPSNDQWHPNSSNFLPNGSSPLPSTSTGPAPSTVAVAPTETLNSLPTSAFSADSTNITIASTTSGSIPSASFLSNYSNASRYPPHSSHHPSVGGSSSHTPPERVGDVIHSNSTPPLMRPSPNENTTRVGNRLSVSIEPSALPSSSYSRNIRRSLSPLVFPPDASSSPSSAITDNSLLRYRTLYSDRHPSNGRLQRRGDDSPVPSPVREVSASHLEDHLSEQPRLSSQERLSDHIRVIRDHSTERETVPSVFDVFNIGPSQGRSRPEHVASRYASATEPVPPRVPAGNNERSRGPTPITTPLNANPVVSHDSHTRLHSSWASIPSSNSLMSESASERRHALALERFRAPVRRSSFDADDESDSRWSGSSHQSGRDLGLASSIPPSPNAESPSGTGMGSQFPSFGVTRTPPSMSRPRSLAEFVAEAQQMTRDEGPEVFMLGWDVSRATERERQRDRDRQRESAWEWERQRERSSQDMRGRSFASGLSLASTSSARDESSHPPVPVSSGPPRPSLGQLGTGPNAMAPNVAATNATLNNNQQYSYSNLNLSSFQSGLFRDSLRRNVEVDQGSFSSSGPAISPMVTGDSRAASRLGLDDSGSEMDWDDFVRARPPSPEWSRPQPYAGYDTSQPSGVILTPFASRTPPPDYSPPPRNFSLRPNLSLLRRGSMVMHDSSGRTQNPNRNTMVFPRPTPIPSGRPTPPERMERDRLSRFFDNLHRPHEGGRRNASIGTGQPYHAQHPPSQDHALASAVSRNERSGPGGPRSAGENGNGSRTGTEVVGENRRGSLGLGGSLRSRLARFANPQSSSITTDVSSSRQRSPSHPIGARPQGVEQHRRGSSASGANTFEQEFRTEVPRASGPPPWVVTTGAADGPVVTRDVPWRATSGPRSTLTPSTSASGSARAEMPEPANRAEEHRSRLRTLRQRLQLDRSNEGMRVFRPGMLRATIGRRGNLGDYMPDELFDDSYEALLSLSSMLGEVRSRATPEEVIASLPTGTFKEWKRDDSETRCPICLDDYEPLDIVSKLIECPHWLHKNCLEQWLRTANTCPVCREKVKASPKPAPARRRPQRDPPGPSGANQGPNSSTSGNGASGRSMHTNPPTNNGRPVLFAALVSDRDERDTNPALWSATSQDGSGPMLYSRTTLLNHLRAQQRQQQPPRESHPSSHVHDAYVPPLPPPHDLPYHLRIPPASQPGSSSVRPTSGTDGSDGRVLGFVSLREHGSDSGMNGVVGGFGARPDANSRRPTGTNGGPMFLDTQMMQRREMTLPFVTPSSTPFTGGSGSMAQLPLPPPPPPQQQPSSFDMQGHGHAPPVTISNSTNPPRDWRNVRMYDAMFHVEASRSSSSSSGVSAPPPRPMGMANRIPLEEDSPFEEVTFGWRFQRAYQEEPTRQGGEGASSGP